MVQDHKYRGTSSGGTGDIECRLLRTVCNKSQRSVLQLAERQYQQMGGFPARKRQTPSVSAHRFGMGEPWRSEQIHVASPQR